MPAIYFVGAVSTLVIGAFYVALVQRRVPAEERGLLLGLAAMTFFMPGLAFYGVREPLDAWVRTVLEPQSSAYTWCRLWYAPVTEELAKLWPLLVPGIARWITSERVPRAAYALGLGFGLGEIAFLALIFGLAPSAANERWYNYTGFFSERLLVAPLHAFFVFVTLAAWRRWRWPGGLLTGFCGGATLHFLLNAPILLKMKGWLGGETLSSQLLLGWILLFFVIAVTVFARALAGRGTTAGGFLFGETDCTRCGAHYQRPLWGLNLGSKRYERCPACKVWHVQ